MRRSHLFNDKGFTLIESLVILSIIIVLSTMSMSAVSSVQQQNLTDYVFETFEQDIFYLQQYSILNQTDPTLLFYPDDHRYIVYDNPFEPPIINRTFNEDVTFHTSPINHRLHFKPTGSIINPGSFHITINSQQYNVTFPFGKGRYYVTEK
ncbi:competence protein ComGD [Alkalibacillus flavidus]|uniref:Competence protein ComGD n=1 Tax=Alkalibacillus flavidus TaxID=546021 RepID=A0ABV2KXH0_9BACI